MILFQAQIEEHQKLAEHYRDLAAKREALAAGLLAFQQQADSDLLSLRLLVDKCKEFAPGAIASLKSAVLNLFDGGDDGNDGGNQPTDPTDPDDDEFELLCLNGETGDYLTTDDLAELESQEAAQTEDDGDSEVSSGTKLTYTQAIKKRCGACWGYEVETKADIKAGFINRTDLGFMELVNLERTGREFYETVETYLNKIFYNGQACQLLECPETSLVGQCYQLTTPLASLVWEDAPLLGQHCTVAFHDAEAKPFVELVMLGDRIGYQRKHDGEILCVYVGFEKKSVAKSWMRFLEPMTPDRVEFRQAQRLQAFKWELKIKGLSIAQIERLSLEDLSKPHCPEIGSSKPSTYRPHTAFSAEKPDEVVC